MIEIINRELSNVSKSVLLVLFFCGGSLLINGSGAESPIDVKAIAFLNLMAILNVFAYLRRARKRILLAAAAAVTPAEKR